ncbi:Crp/Fnr family transcriptional regulator [Streptomyces sp. NPDC093252]|uniref:Crp/Fnr family transcriptional regulator n=1 Tax=Streptomyces sp. NPDC093252 TaxID=3154980 RepID=UPI00341DF50E
MTHVSNPRGRVTLLPHLLPEARTAFTGLGRRRPYAVGEAILHEGDTAQELVVLHEGVVKVTVRLDRDRESLVDIRIGEDVLGEGTAMGVGPRSATVTSCGAVCASLVPRAELDSFLHDHPEVSMALNRVFSARLRRADRLRLELGRYPVQVRLARVLVELAETYGGPARPYGKPDPNTARIDVCLSQPELAALTACAPDTVHVALTRLRRSGIISTESQQRTVVRDMARLREVALLRTPTARRGRPARRR